MPTAGTVRLLIADDDPTLLGAYTLFFEAHRYAVQTAADGVGALAAYFASHPDVVILDIEMPRLDGLAVAREVRRMGVYPIPLHTSLLRDLAHVPDAGNEVHYSLHA